MTIGTVTVNGVEVGIEVVGTSEVQNIDGSRELHVFLAPVIPGGGGPDGGEPLPIPKAA